MYRDVQASLGEDPAGVTAQSLAARWLALTQSDTGSDPAIRAGWCKAWTDQQDWPAALKQRMAEFDVERIAGFISEAVWIKRDRELEQQRQTEPRPPDRVSESRMALFRDVEASLGADLAGEEARALVSRWDALLESETGGDLEIKSSVMKAWTSRRKWPAGLRRYVASTYAMEPQTWEKVTDFIDEASASVSTGTV